MHLEDGDFSIASYDLGSYSTIKTCSAIKMKITRCESTTATANFHEAIWPDSGPECLHGDFREHYEEILKGQNECWILASVSIRPACLELEYYSSKYDLCENVRLDINGTTRIKNIDLRLEVPHIDGSPATEYLIMMEYRKYGSATCGSTIVQVSFPHSHQRRVFMVTSLHPHELSVTDLFDL